MALRILAVQTFGGFISGGSTGGGVIHFVNLLREWSRQGSEVHLITNDKDVGIDRYHSFASVHVLPTHPRSGFSDSLSFLYGAIGNHRIQRAQIDRLCDDFLLTNRRTVTLATSPALSDVLAARQISRRLQCPAVIYFHHPVSPIWWFPLRRGSPFRNLGSQVLYDTSMMTTKVSNLRLSFDDPTVNSGWRFDQPILPHYGALDSEHSAPPTLQPTSSRSYDACSIGRITRNKGTLDLIRCWAGVVAKIPNAKLLISGTAQSLDFQNEVKSLIHKLDLSSNVGLRGYVLPAEKQEILGSSKLFVFPSYEEGWSLSVMEAAAYGALPVVYNIPAFRYLGSAAEFVPVGRVDLLSSKVIALLTAQDEVYLRAVAAAQTVSSFNIERVATDELVMLQNLRRN
jgi:glycosyltransferase involved in cell wall biosynthesis